MNYHKIVWNFGEKPVHDFPHFLMDDAWVNNSTGSLLHPQDFRLCQQTQTKEKTVEYQKSLVFYQIYT